MKDFLDIESLMIFQNKLKEYPIEAFFRTESEIKRTKNEMKKSHSSSRSSSSNYLKRATSMINQTARNISLMI